MTNPPFEMAAQIVTDGPFMGKNLQQMEDVLAKWMSDVDSCGSDIASASYNGDSFTYGQRRDIGLWEKGERIKEAFWMLGDTRFGQPAGSMAVMRPYNNSRYA